MFIRIVSILIFIVSLTWMIVDPGFEPAIGIGTSLIGLLTLWIKNRNKKTSDTIQTQNVGDHSVGIQAGGNVKINTLKN